MAKAVTLTLHCSAHTVITNPMNKLNAITLNETISFTFITDCCYSCEAGRKPHRRSKFILLNRLPQPVSQSILLDFADSIIWICNFCEMLCRTCADWGNYIAPVALFRHQE